MTSWTDAPYVFLPPPPRAACPHCGGDRYPIIVRSRSESDGSVTRRCVCRDCSRRYVVVVDPDLPAAGSDVDLFA